MSLDAVPNGSNDPSEPSMPRRVPARRMTQRELVILSLLVCPDGSRTRGLA
jgi:hypothetical protein